MQEVCIKVPQLISGLFHATHHFICMLSTSSGFYFLLWAVIGLLWLTAEVGHPGLFLFLSFAFGSLIAAIVGFSGLSFLVQCISFLLGTAIAFFVLRRWVVKEQKHGHRSNVYALQGKEGVIIKAVTGDECGQVTVEGEVWRAQSHEHKVLPVKTSVRIVAVRGTRLIVEEVKKSENYKI